ncbi:PspC domain-containing protein [Sphingomonas sp.]|jgi:phage shock protein PspC (stress-responsive transcriptional regulator)|uniref:PspC domain-containing protein n=1 Tax=Sphingomonas sp. TaxID=28214 RepID=UPI002EDA497F
MHDSHTAPTNQKDNLLGICAALGADFGFNPFYLRVALGAGILWNPVAMVVGYLALGAVVLATRLLVPDARSATADVQQIGPARTAPNARANDTVELAEAA